MLNRNLLFGVLMANADHLREINDNRFIVFHADEDVELVEVAVNET